MWRSKCECSGTCLVPWQEKKLTPFLVEMKEGNMDDAHCVHMLSCRTSRCSSQGFSTLGTHGNFSSRCCTHKKRGIQSKEEEVVTRLLFLFSPNILGIFPAWERDEWTAKAPYLTPLVWSISIHLLKMGCTTLTTLRTHCVFFSWAKKAAATEAIPAAFLTRVFKGHSMPLGGDKRGRMERADVTWPANVGIMPYF